MPIVLEKNFFKINYFALPILLKHNFTRNLCNNPEDYKTFSDSGQKKEKVVVLKKIFQNDPNIPPKVLIYKKASDVIKEWNWENKQLFGPVQSNNKSENYSYNKKKVDDINKYIQHQTSLPIKEPKIKTETKHKSYFTSNVNNLGTTIKTFDFSRVLKFPLINQPREAENEINELNILRKYLESKSNFSIPSVTSILDKTMPKESKEALDRWRKNMIEKLGEKGFEVYQRELLKNGASLHASINSYLSATPASEIHVEEPNLGHWRSLKAVFSNISEVKLLEEKVNHPFLCYKGIVDCFAKYKEHLVVIDWKTSKKAKTTLSSTFDNPLQIAAYVGALNFDPKFQYLANKGVIVVAYESGTPANVHFMDEQKLLQYWKEWLIRIKIYWESVDSTHD